MKVASLRATQHYHKPITSNAEVILNDQSNRKSPSCVAFRPLPAYRITHEDENNNSSSAFIHLLERSFAESAEALQARFPEQVVCSPTLLLDQSRATSSPASMHTSSCLQCIDQTHYWNKHFPFTQLNQSFFVNEALSEMKEHEQHDEYNHPFFCKTAPSSECSSTDNTRLAVHLPLPKLNSLDHEERSSGNNNNEKLSTQHSPAFASYEVEEVIAMLLQYAQRLAENADMHDSTLTAEEYVQLFDHVKSTSTNGKGANNVKQHKKETTKNENSLKTNKNNNDDINDEKEGEEIDDAKRSKITENVIPPRHPIQSVTLTIPTNTPLQVIQRLHDAAEMAGFTSIDFKSNTMSAAITLAQLRPQLFTANKNKSEVQNKISNNNDDTPLEHINRGVNSNKNSEEAKEEYEEFYKLYQNTYPSLRTDSNLYNESTFVMIYDMGYAHTEASVFAFSPQRRLYMTDIGSQTLDELRRINDEAHGKMKTGHAIPDKDAKVKKEVHNDNAEVLELITSITNNNLGGRDFDICIANYWDRTFLNNSVFNSTLISHSKHYGNDPENKDKQNVLFELTYNEASELLSTFADKPREVLKRQEALLRAARRTREMLSVNSNVPVTVEGIHVPVHHNHDNNNKNEKNNKASSSSQGYSSISFSTTLSRNTFETECSHLFQQAIAMRDAAVQSAREWVLYKTMEYLPMKINSNQEIEVIKLDRIEVIGGATRMPRLLYLLEKPTNFASSSSASNLNDIDNSIKKENKKDKNDEKKFREVKKEINIAHSDGYRVGRTLNADEAIVLGAVNSASKSVQKEVYVLDKPTTNILFGLKNRTPNSSSSNEKDEKEEVVTLFEAYKYTLPSVKTIRLENRTTDLVFSLYEENKRTLKLYEEKEKKWQQSKLHADYTNNLIRSYAITGVSEAVEASKQLQTYERIVTRYNENVTNTANATDDSILNKSFSKQTRNMSLHDSFVVIETLIGENGMPRLNKAYLLATYNVNGLITQVDDDEEELLQTTKQITEDEADLLSTRSKSNKNIKTVNIEAKVTNTSKIVNANTSSTIQVPYYKARGKLNFYNVNEVDYVFPLHIEVIRDKNTHESNCGPVMSSSRKKQGQLNVHEWQRADFTRLHCSALRNQLEEQLGETNFDVITLRTEVAQKEAERVTEWRSIIRSLMDWMEDESERATVHELEEQIAKVKSIKQQVRAIERKYEKENSSKEGTKYTL